MAVDYDLVIIGATEVGIYIAKKAALLQARVALVTQEIDLATDYQFTSDRLSELGRDNYHLANHPIISSSNRVSLATAQGWHEQMAATDQRRYSLSNLAALGVDVVAERGEFCRLPKLSFQTAKRQLRSRNFVLTTGARFDARERSDAERCPTLDEVWQTDLSDLGDTIVVGGNPAALELAQILARFERQVSLITPQSRILPEEDLEFALLLQAQLEAEGVKLYTDTIVERIKSGNEEVWLQAGDRALKTNRLIFADRKQPNISGLNLAGVGVKCDRRKVLVNSRLQTDNPQIYACGEVIGGYNQTSIAHHEAHIVLKNTLWVARYRVNYHPQPWAIFTQPNFARVGLTLERAQKQCDKLYVVREYVRDLERARVANFTTGMCQLLVRENGEIVGANLICDRAAELMTEIALLMQQGIKLDLNPMRGLTSLSMPIQPGMSEIWQRAFDNFYQQKLQGDRRLLNRLQSWFSWRKECHD